VVGSALVLGIGCELLLNCARRPCLYIAIASCENIEDRFPIVAAQAAADEVLARWSVGHRVPFNCCADDRPFRRDRRGASRNLVLPGQI